MLRITMNKSAAGAKKYYSEGYYSEGKSLDNYYSEKGESIGTWGGKAAEQLGLTGEINYGDFAALCDNKNPGNEKKLTARNDSERRVGYDFTFNACKSVSLAYTFGTQDEKKEILTAFRESVKNTMQEIEKGMLTRVRNNGQNTDKETGNIAYGEFIHFTTRPVDGIPDPHLHAHCFVFNATFVNEENKWKAGQFGQIKQDAPYYEALFHSGFAGRLQEKGYGITRTENGFELKGIGKDTTDKFSLRTKEIEEVAAEHNITDSKKKAGIGARTRESKRDVLDKEDIVLNWQGRLSQDEEARFRNLKSVGNWKEEDISKDIAVDAVDYSLKHHLERKSVSTDKEILTTAIKSSIGGCAADKVINAFRGNKSVISIREENNIFITTTEALQEENTLIRNVNELKGGFKPINENYWIKNDALSVEQQKAVMTALNSIDGITIIAGKAGTGKTTLMKEIQQGIKDAGKEIYAFAPSAEASRVVQRKEGFENAETVALLIQNKESQAKLKNGVIWIDEAGLLSNRDMNKVLDIAKEQNARLILTGDTKQHSSVERGDALRIIQQEAGIMPVTVNKIQRQKNKEYREAVKHLAKDDTDKGFSRLDRSGAIHEIADHEERIAAISEDYHKSSFRGSSREASKEVLVISPTHIEGRKVSEAIRERLKEKNIISAEEKGYKILRNLQLTAAEKDKAENYNAGNYLVFHQNIKGIKAGSKYEITGTADNDVYLKDENGRFASVNIINSKCYNVFREEDISISQGDKIRITGNGKTREGVHLFNGTVYQVKGFDRQGNIRLSNGTTLDRDYGSFTHGYVMTSHASQGKTVDKIIISQSSMSFRASSKEQFYVSVSRGREAVSIYTDDKEDLLRSVSRSAERKSATELTESLNNRIIEMTRRDIFSRIKEKALYAAERIMAALNNKSYDYEQLQRTGGTKDFGKER